SVHHIWCPLSSQEYQDLPDGAETTLTFIEQIDENKVPDLHVLTGIPVLYEMNENRAITARYSLE
ncbi:2,3-diphosphoglycerate-dependent phosphoglycerate mutase, partial [Klebsiella pneumoniae]